MIAKKLKNNTPKISELYPNGYHIDWEKYSDDMLGLPIDIYYKFYPIKTTWLLRQKHHSNQLEEVESS